MKILALDSTAKTGSVALVDDKKIIGSFFINTALTHSQTLVPMIDALLKSTNTEAKDVDVFAISAGPGSFTGVRIGVAAVKGMAMALDKKCASVSTLEAMAYNYIQEDVTVVSVMDARCQQVYNANFLIDNGEITRLCEDRALSIEDLANDLQNIDGKIILVGDGAELCYNNYKDRFSDIHLAPEHIRYQNAFGVAYASMDKELMSADELMPMYLRLPQAERELKKRMENKE